MWNIRRIIHEIQTSIKLLLVDLQILIDVCKWLEWNNVEKKIMKTFQ